jgi:C4-dicarboxylate-binding protein DctP
MRIGGYQGENSVHTRAVRKLAADLARTTGSDLDIAITPDVTAHGHRAADLLAMVAVGRLELCYFSSSYLAARAPTLGLFDLPFMQPDRARAYARLDGDLGTTLAAHVAAATPYRVLGFWDNGFRHMSNRLRPIHHPDDCRGMRIRTLDNALHQEVFAALGFEPVVVDVKDLVPAVERHEVDAQENPLTYLYNFGMHRTHRHVSMTSHILGVALVLANRAWFDALAAPLQATICSAMAGATAMQRDLAVAEDVICLERLRADGVAIVPHEDIDRAAFAAVVAGIVRRETKRLGVDIGDQSLA